MNIMCICGQQRNYYFKNIPFKKGNFKLSFNRSKTSILGKKIKTTKKLQNTLFKNVYTRNEKNRTFKDLHFKNLKLIEINLNDTTNVKLKKID